MFDPANSEVLWLNVTNIILGLVTLTCLVIVGSVLFREVTARVISRAHVPVASDDHAFELGELGITMADGGERMDKQELNKKACSPSKDGADISRRIID